MDDARDLSNPMFTRPPLILRINKLEKKTRKMQNKKEKTKSKSAQSKKHKSKIKVIKGKKWRKKEKEKRKAKGREKKNKTKQIQSILKIMGKHYIYIALATITLYTLGIYMNKKQQTIKTKSYFYFFSGLKIIGTSY
jgi:ATP-dependent 26S proteasome regulatory subunit